VAGKVTLPLDQVEARWRWWNSRPRTEAWAARYGGEFARIERLFADSLAALEADRAQKISAERRERELLESQAKLDRMRADEAIARARRTRALALAFLLFGLLAFASAAYGFFESRKVGEANVALQEQARKLQLSTQQARSMGSEAETARGQAERQAALAREASTRAEKQTAIAKAQALALQKQTALAESQRAEAVKQKNLAEYQTEEANRARIMATKEQTAELSSERHSQVLGVKREALQLAYQSSQRDSAADDVALAALQASSLDRSSLIRTSLLAPLAAYSGIRRARIPPYIAAVTAGSGGTLVVTLQTPHEAARTTALVMDARRLTVRSELTNFPAETMCGFDDKPQVAASDGSALALYDVGEKPHQIATNALGKIDALACLQRPDGVVVATHDGSIRTYLLQNGEFVEHPPARHVDGPVAALVATPKGSLIAAVPPRGKQFTLLGTPGVTPTATIALFEDASFLVRCVRGDCAASIGFSPDAKRVAWCDTETIDKPSADNKSTVKGRQTSVYVAAVASLSNVTKKPIASCPEGSLISLDETGMPEVVTATNIYTFGDNGYVASFANSWGFYTAADNPPPAPTPPPGADAQWGIRHPNGPPNPIYDSNLLALVTPEIGGISLRSESDEFAPLLGRQSSPSFRGCIAMWGHKMYYPGVKAPVEFDLDLYRAQYDRYQEAPSTCLYDSGAGIAVSMDYKSDKLQLWDFTKASPQKIGEVPYAPPTYTKDAKGVEQIDDYPRAAYDPATRAVTVFDKNGVHRTSASGRTTFVPTKDLWERFRPPGVTEHERYDLSPRGGYLYYTYSDGPVRRYLLLTAAGTFVGIFDKAIPSFALDDRTVVGLKHGDDSFSLYDLPHAKRRPGLLLEGASPAAISPDGRQLAFVDRDTRSIDLFDLNGRTYAGHLPKPPFSDRLDSPFIDLRFSGDGRYLVAEYRYNNDGNWGDAVYSVDPKDWQEELCLRIARGMDKSEQASFHASNAVDPCRPFRRNSPAEVEWTTAK
jgi:hypothetical protein